MLVYCPLAHADGGTVRFSERVGGYQVTVFTAPVPLRAGPVEVSVLVQDATTSRPLPEARVNVILTQSDSRLTSPATTASATNKLLHDARFDLPAAGAWQVEVEIEGEHGPAKLRFPVAAGPPPPRWLEMGFWITLPGWVVLLFAVHQLLVRRQLKL